MKVLQKYFTFSHFAVNTTSIQVAAPKYQTALLVSCSSSGSEDQFPPKKVMVECKFIIFIIRENNVIIAFEKIMQRPY